MNRNANDKREDSVDKSLLQMFLIEMDKLHQGKHCFKIWTSEQKKFFFHYVLDLLHSMCPFLCTKDTSLLDLHAVQESPDILKKFDLLACPIY